MGFAALYGPLGEVLVNPYGMAPLTAIIKNGGYELLSAHVRVVPKKGGCEIAYDVSRSQLLTHGGVPVFGLYPDYQNQVEVTAKKRFKGEVSTVKFHVFDLCGSDHGHSFGLPEGKEPSLLDRREEGRQEIRRPPLLRQQSRHAESAHDAHRLEQPDGRRDDLAVPAQDRHHRHQGRSALVPRLPRPLEAPRIRIPTA